MPTENEEQQPTHQKSKVIIPPPEIKSVIEKTSSYVAKNGSSFEQMIMKVEQSNPKFNFLKYADDPYRPYYLQKLAEYSGVADQKEVTQIEHEETKGQNEEGQTKSDGVVVPSDN